ncbi:hypothetical protein [Geoalkalibacter sp.]|uniref:hypothetical protein n=1 Tax=Geoalkalibacter sp. TaxID=3041440 RepID=UPI00272E5C91|nr:hypothetical protein [Geoalkalibacter sp.]
MSKPSKRTYSRRLWLPAGSALAFLLVSVLLGAALWQGRDLLLNRYLKPHLEELLSRRLDAQVAIARLELEERHLRIGGLSLEQPGVYRLFVLGLSVDFSLERLRRGGLDAVRLFAPDLFLDVAALGGGDAPESRAAITRSPIEVDQVAVLDGRLHLVAEGREWLARELNLALRGVPAPEFNLRLILEGEHPLDLEAAGRLAWNASPELHLQELQVDGQSLLTSPLQVRPVPGGVKVGGEIHLPALDREQLDVWFAASREPSPLPADLDFSARDLVLGVEWAPGQMEGRLRCAQLRVSRPDQDWPVEDIDLHFSGRPAAWQAQGQALVAGELAVQLSLQGGDERLGGEVRAQTSDLAFLAKRLGFADNLPLSGGFAGGARFDWRERRLDLAGEFHGRPPRASAAPAPLRLAPLSGRLRLAGPVKKLAGELALDLDGRPFLEARGDAGQLDAQLHETPLAALARLMDAALWPKPVEKQGRIGATANLKRTQDGWQGRAVLGGEGWRTAGFDLGASEAEGRFSWRANRLDLGEARLRTSLAGMGVSVPHLDLQGAGHWQGGAARIDLAHLRLEAVDYLAADDMSALAGGALDLSGRLTRRGDGEFQAELRGTARVQEVLAGGFYAELAQLPLFFALNARWSPNSTVLAVDNLHLQLPAVGTLDGRGSWRAGKVLAEGQLHLPHLDEGYNRHLRPLLAPLYPLAGDLDLRGSLSLHGVGRWEGTDWRFSGTLLPENLAARLGDGALALSGLRGILPFSLAPPGQTGAEHVEGFLAFSRLQAGPLSADHKQLALTSGLNRLAFVDPWELDLAGGSVHLEQLRLAWEPRGLYLAGRTRILGIDLEQLTQALDAPLMHGSLTADFGEFEYAGGFLQSQGEARLAAFGGGIRVRNLRARDIFSSYRSFEADIDLHGLDLAQLTQTFEFGEINGIIDGYIHDLRLFGRVPSAFIAEISTRERGRRNISVKAINNLAVISQGGLSAALSRGVYRFIDFYRYRRIGMFCGLRNDVFVLRGTARPGSDLYLVDGGLLPPRIDVLAPQSAISFREMLRRLGRIDRAGTR